MKHDLEAFTTARLRNCHELEHQGGAREDRIVPLAKLVHGCTWDWLTHSWYAFWQFGQGRISGTTRLELFPRYHESNHSMASTITGAFGTIPPRPVYRGGLSPNDL